MALLRNLLLAVPLLYGLTVTGTALGKESDDGEIIHEVAHPRVCLLIDGEQNLTGAAENFAHGSHAEGNDLEMDLIVMKGTTVYFKSGFGYEAVWYAGASGILYTSIEVSMDGTHVDTKTDEMNATGPKIEAGSVSVPITFGEAGEFTVKSILITKAKTADGNILAYDLDTVITHVTVYDGPEILLVYPENGAILPHKPPPIFEWEAFGFKKFQLQLSTSDGFAPHSTLTLPPYGGTKKHWMKMKKKLWKLIRFWEEENGVIYWRVIGMTKGGEEDVSQIWQFSIED